MASKLPSDRFRPATDFPKTIVDLGKEDATQLYVELRECLIFTNRSRAQLLRRNVEHKNNALQLKEDVQRLQGLIHQLTAEKRQLAASSQAVVAELEEEMTLMGSHLDRLSDAFETVAEVEAMEQAQWSFLALPARFFRFLRTVKAIVSWWQDERNPELSSNLEPSETQLPGQLDTESDRRENPQMYTDQASQGRSLLDR